LRILFHTAGIDREAWIDALQRALPEAHIESWTAGSVCRADYALLWKPPLALVEHVRGVRAIFNLGAGVDSIPDFAALPRTVALVRLDDAGMAEQMVEYVIHALLRHYREFDTYAEQQHNGLWQPRPRRLKSDFVVGILGAGVLGAAVASAIATLHFPVRTWSRTSRAIAAATSFTGISELETFLSATRVLVCLLPLTRETEGLLDRERLSRLPRGAYLINVARGALVADADLLELLDAGHLSGATLDVFRDEPLPREHRFWHHPRVALTPHVSAVTLVEESVQQIVEKIRRLEAGLPITGVVDRERGY
jgi:glyoxylate/hydroxypyruvate reductase A